MGKHLVDFILHPVAETVDGDEIRFLISGKPDIMDVTVKELFDFPAGVDVVHIGIQNDLEHHPGMVRAAPAFLIQLPETFKVQALNRERQPSELDHALQYPRQFLEEKALFGWDCKDENVSLS